MLFISGNQNRTTKSSQISSFSRITPDPGFNKRIICEKFIQKWQLNNIQYHSQCGTQIKPIFAIMFDSNIELLCVTLQNLLHPNIVARQPRFHFHKMEINDSTISSIQVF